MMMFTKQLEHARGLVERASASSNWVEKRRLIAVAREAITDAHRMAAAYAKEPAALAFDSAAWGALSEALRELDVAAPSAVPVALERPAARPARPAVSSESERAWQGKQRRLAEARAQLMAAKIQRGAHMSG